MNKNIAPNFTNKSFGLDRISTREWDIWDYSLLACLIFGTIGNSLSIIVISAKKLRKTNAALFVYINIYILKN